MREENAGYLPRAVQVKTLAPVNEIHDQSYLAGSRSYKETRLAGQGLEARLCGGFDHSFSVDALTPVIDFAIERYPAIRYG